MNLNHLLILITGILLTQCTVPSSTTSSATASKDYYYGELATDLIFTPTSGPPVLIPGGSQVIVRSHNSKTHYLIYKNYSGYVSKRPYRNYHKYDAKTDGYLYGYYVNDSGIHRDVNYVDPNELAPKSIIADSTYKSTPSYNLNTSGEVHVKGYYRKDGTYVRPHTRSTPKRN